MRILHVITSMYIGGAEHLLVDLLPELRKGGENEVELLLFNGVETSFRKQLASRGVPTHVLGNTNDVYNPMNIFKMTRFMGEFDVIHTHNTACQLYVPMAKWLSFTFKPLVTTEHNATNRRRGKWWLKPIDKWMYNRYAAIICIADQTRKNLEEYIGEQNKIFTVYNGVDTNRFVRPVKDITGQKEFVITMVSAFRDQKDFETLLRAMKHLPDAYRLQIVGGGYHVKQDQVKKYCTDLGLDSRVDFMGLRDDVADIQEKSDIIVLSSHWEGLSLSSIEGMASGRPFVASDVDGLREIVADAGVLFPEGDDVALANCIKNLCEHPDTYREVANKCQRRSRKYDITLMARKYLDIYKRVRRR